MVQAQFTKDSHLGLDFEPFKHVAILRPKLLPYSSADMLRSSILLDDEP